MELTQALDDGRGIDEVDIVVGVPISEWFHEPYSVFLKSGLGVCEEPEVRPGDLDTLEEDAFNAAIEKTTYVHVALQPILESVLVLKTDPQEAVLAMVVFPHDSVRPFWEGTLEYHSSRCDCEAKAIERGRGIPSGK